MPFYPLDGSPLIYLGHKGVQPSFHMDGIFRLFKVTRGSILPLNALSMQSDFLIMINAVKSIQDITYYARYDLADVKYGGQAVYNMEVG